MKRTIQLFLGTLLVSAGIAHANEVGPSTAQYLWVAEPGVATDFRAQLGVGYLDRKLTGSRGVMLTNYFGVDYALSPDFGINLGLPLAGTLSGGPDGYSLGNVELGAKYTIPMDRLTVIVGANLALPSARTDAAVGLFTRQYTRYVKDQFAVSPYLALSYAKDRITLTADFGTDLQIFTKAIAGHDRVEDVIFYDGAAALNFFENLWATIEMGGYSTVTYKGNNQTSLFAGPGIRYQDREISFGVHVVAPFRQPDRGVYKVMAVADLRVGF